jgi:hypothetical protein
MTHQAEIAASASRAVIDSATTTVSAVRQSSPTMKSHTPARSADARVMPSLWLVVGVEWGARWMILIVAIATMSTPGMIASSAVSSPAPGLSVLLGLVLGACLAPWSEGF